MVALIALVVALAVDHKQREMEKDLDKMIIWVQEEIRILEGRL